MADNTRNDGKNNDRRNAGKRNGGRADAKPRSAQPKAENKAQAKPRRDDNRQKAQPSRLELSNRSWALGAAAVGTAVLAGLAYAAWQHHAEIADAFEDLFDGDEDDDAETGIATGSANAEGASFATNGTTPTTQRKGRAARDVPPTGDERAAFAAATVPVGETERTDSPATA